MPFNYFALGTSLATLANLEAILTDEPPPHVLEGGRIPLLGPIRRRTLGQTVQRNGVIDVPIRFDVLHWSNLDSLITTYFGYTSGYAALYATWLAEDGYYYPYAVTLERPYEGEQYRLVDSVNARDITIPAFDWVRQVNTENSTTTITTSERYTESDTTGGAVVLTLPAAAAVEPNTLFGFSKTGGANALTLDGDGSEEINGNTTLVVTGRVDIQSDGVSAWTSI